MMIPSASEAPSGALHGVRVIEIASPLTQYCGKMFAELGADVILVEPPGGSVLRHVPPFIDDEPGANRSLAYNYFNTSKRAVTLDIARPQGGELFRNLARTADLVLEGEKPGTLSSWRCGYADLASAKRSIVVTSITGFGQTGPYAQYETEDLVGLATGGFLYLGGFPDAPPVGAYGNQAYLGAAMYGAVAAMLALTNAESTGEGEHIDVSMQECMVMAMETAVQFYDLEGKIRKRHAGEQRFAGTAVFECSDGYIYMMASGIGANKFWPITLQWMIDEKVAGVERLRGEEWHRPEYVVTDEAKRIFAEVFGPWAKSKSKNYIFEEGQRRHIPLAAINTVADLLTSKQLAHRKFFVDVTHPETGKVLRMPGAPYQLTCTPWRLRNAAPSIGQHNREIYAGVGVSAAEVDELVREGVL